MKVHVIDQEFLGQPQVIASFLVEGPEGNVLLETGPASTRLTLERKLTELGFTLDSIGHVLVSHIHLDHSGGAGYWAERGADIYVHHKGARHIVDPERLLSSATRIYQDKMDYLWGQTIAAPKERVVALEEGTFRVAGLEIEALDTPGHAGHHFAFRIGSDVFTGDVAGVRLPGLNYVSVPAPPPEFNLEVWLESLAKLRAVGAGRFYLTHFGEVTNPASHLDQLEKRLHDCVDFVKENLHENPEELSRLYQKWERSQALAAGVGEADYEAYEKGNPSFMSAQGISRYWHKRLQP